MRTLLEEHGVVVDVSAAVHHDDVRVLDALRVRQSMRVCACSLPTSSLSKDT